MPATTPLAVGLEERQVGGEVVRVEERPGRVVEGATPLEWARGLAENEALRGMGVRVLDGLADVTELRRGRGMLAPAALFALLEPEDHVLVVPVKKVGTSLGTVWRHPGIGVPAILRRLGYQVKDLPPHFAEAKERLKEAKPEDLVLVSAAFGEETREQWTALLRERGLLGLVVPPDADLTDLALDDLAAIQAILKASGGSLFVLAVRAVDIDGQRHLLLYL